SPGKGNILNDDVRPTVSIADVQIKEGNSGTTDAVFTLTMSAPSSVPVTIDYSTEDGTAWAGQDYLPAHGTVSFKPGVGSGATNSTPDVQSSLRLVRIGNQWQLSWTSPGDLYFVQERDAFGQGAWANLAGSVMASGNEYSVLVDSAAGAKFYQLVPKMPLD